MSSLFRDMGYFMGRVEAVGFSSDLLNEYKARIRQRVSDEKVQKKYIKMVEDWVEARRLE